MAATVKPGTRRWTRAMRAKLGDKAPASVSASLGMGSRAALATLRHPGGSRIYPGTRSAESLMLDAEKAEAGKAADKPEAGAGMNPTGIEVTTDESGTKLIYSGGPAAVPGMTTLTFAYDDDVPQSAIFEFGEGATVAAIGQAVKSILNTDSDHALSATSSAGTVTVGLGSAESLDRLEATVTARD